MRISMNLKEILGWLSNGEFYKYINETISDWNIVKMFKEEDK